MNHSIQRLPGIKFIGWLYGNHLKPNVFLDGIVNQPVPILTDVHEIFFCDNPQCRCKTEKNEKGYTDTATLSFLSATILPITREQNIAFVVTDINDDSWLIGAHEHPFATFNVEQMFGAPDGEGSGFQYEITHVSCKSMIPCILSTT